MKKNVIVPLAAAAFLGCTFTTEAQVTLTADPADYGASPVMFTLDPELYAPAQRGIATTRQLRQTFQLSASLDVEEIVIGAAMNGAAGGLVLDFYEVDDVEAGAWTPGALVHTISLDTSAVIPVTSTRLQVSLAGADVFSLLQRDSGSQGYGIEISNFDDVTSVGLVRHSNDGTEHYTTGRFYKEDGNPSGTGRDLGISLSGTIIPEPTTFALAGLGSVALLVARKRR